MPPDGESWRPNQATVSVGIIIMEDDTAKAEGGGATATIAGDGKDATAVKKKRTSRSKTPPHHHHSSNSRQGRPTDKPRFPRNKDRSRSPVSKKKIISRTVSDSDTTPYATPSARDSSSSSSHQKLNQSKGQIDKNGGKKTRDSTTLVMEDGSFSSKTGRSRSPASKNYVVSQTVSGSDTTPSATNSRSHHQKLNQSTGQITKNGGKKTGGSTALVMEDGSFSSKTGRGRSPPLKNKAVSRTGSGTATSATNNNSSDGTSHKKLNQSTGQITKQGLKKIGDLTTLVMEDQSLSPSQLEEWTTSQKAPHETTPKEDILESAADADATTRKLTKEEIPQAPDRLNRSYSGPAMSSRSSSDDASPKTKKNILKRSISLKEVIMLKELTTPIIAPGANNNIYLDDEGDSKSKSPADKSRPQLHQLKHTTVNNMRKPSIAPRHTKPIPSSGQQPPAALRCRAESLLNHPLLGTSHNASGFNLSMSMMSMSMAEDIDGSGVVSTTSNNNNHSNNNFDDDTTDNTNDDNHHRRRGSSLSSSAKSRSSLSQRTTGSNRRQEDEAKTRTTASDNNGNSSKRGEERLKRRESKRQLQKLKSLSSRELSQRPKTLRRSISASATTETPSPTAAEDATAEEGSKSLSRRTSGRSARSGRSRLRSPTSSSSAKTEENDSTRHSKRSGMSSSSRRHERTISKSRSGNSSARPPERRESRSSSNGGRRRPPERSKSRTKNENSHSSFTNSGGATKRSLDNSNNNEDENNKDAATKQDSQQKHDADRRGLSRRRDDAGKTADETKQESHESHRESTRNRGENRRTRSRTPKHTPEHATTGGSKSTDEATPKENTVDTVKVTAAKQLNENISASSKSRRFSHSLPRNQLERSERPSFPRNVARSVSPAPRKRGASPSSRHRRTSPSSEPRDRSASPSSGHRRTASPSSRRRERSTGPSSSHRRPTTSTGAAVETAEGSETPPPRQTPAVAPLSGMTSRQSLTISSMFELEEKSKDVALDALSVGDSSASQSTCTEDAAVDTVLQFDPTNADSVSSFKVSEGDPSLHNSGVFKMENLTVSKSDTEESCEEEKPSSYLPGTIEAGQKKSSTSPVGGGRTRRRPRERSSTTNRSPLHKGERKPRESKTRRGSLTIDDAVFDRESKFNDDDEKVDPSDSKALLNQDSQGSSGAFGGQQGGTTTRHSRRQRLRDRRMSKSGRQFQARKQMQYDHDDDEEEESGYLPHGMTATRSLSPNREPTMRPGHRRAQSFDPSFSREDEEASSDSSVDVDGDEDETQDGPTLNFRRKSAVSFIKKQLKRTISTDSAASSDSKRDSVAFIKKQLKRTLTTEHDCTTSSSENSFGDPSNKRRDSLMVVKNKFKELMTRKDKHVQLLGSNESDSDCSEQ